MVKIPFIAHKLISQSFSNGKTLLIIFQENQTLFSITVVPRTSQPSVTQLQDVPDLNQPGRISVGNPGLKQEFAHTVDLSFKNLTRLIINT